MGVQTVDRGAVQKLRVFVLMLRGPVQGSLCWTMRRCIPRVRQRHALLLRRVVECLCLAQTLYIHVDQVPVFVSMKRDNALHRARVSKGILMVRVLVQGCCLAPYLFVAFAWVRGQTNNKNGPMNYERAPATSLAGFDIAWLHGTKKPF